MFHKEGMAFGPRKLLKEIIAFVVPGPYVSQSAADNEQGSTQTGDTAQTPSLSVAPQVEQQFTRTAMSTSPPPMVHPDLRDRSLANLRRQQQESLARIAASQAGSPGNPPLGSSAYGGPTQEQKKNVSAS